MAYRRTILLLLCLASANVCQAKILAVFQGKIVRTIGPVRAKQWLFVQGKSGFVRKVAIAHASVEYDDGFPIERRNPKPVEALVLSTQVRITAQRKKDAWQAEEVLILTPRREAVSDFEASLFRPRTMRTAGIKSK